MTSLKKQNGFILIKLFALLSIVRWLNILLTIIAQYLAAVFVLNPSKTYIEILSNPKLHLMTLASAFIIAGGYIINNFYDLEKDLVNRPDKTLFGRVVSRQFCLNCYFLFNTIGLGLAMMASWRIFIFYLFFALALWAYSHKFQKIPFLREITASLLSVTSFFSIGIFYKYITVPLFLYGCFAMLIIFSREIIKGIEAYKGNAIFGYGTLATSLGKIRSAYIILILHLLAFVPLLILWFHFKLSFFGILLSVINLILMAMVYLKLYRNFDDKNAAMIHTFYKIFIVFIIFLVVLIPAKVL